MILRLLELKGIRVEHAYIYGSRARGVNDAESDIDLLRVSDIFDTDDDAILSRPWIYTSNIDARIEPVAVGKQRFINDTASPLLESVRREGIAVL